MAAILWLTEYNKSPHTLFHISLNASELGFLSKVMQAAEPQNEKKLWNEVVRRCLENESTNRQPTVAFLVPCLISFNWVKTASLSLRTRTKSKLSIFEQLESGSKSTRSQVRVKSSQLNCKMLSKVVELSSSCVDALDHWPKIEGRYCGQKKLLWYLTV